MAVISMKQLLEAGVHFGHQTRRWNPKMAPYIFTDRNGIYIIDLQKTVKKVEEAYNFVKQLSSDGDTILFVGTKKQAQEAVREEAERCSMFYVNQAGWAVCSPISKPLDAGSTVCMNWKMEANGTLEVLPKEVAELMHERDKLQNSWAVSRRCGVYRSLFVIDPRKERIAVAEARKPGIPIAAL